MSFLSEIRVRASPGDIRQTQQRAVRNLPQSADPVRGPDKKWSHITRFAGSDSFGADFGGVFGQKRSDLAAL